jgi:phage FluMu protein Com
MNEQGNFENWLFHMHFVCPRCSGFPKTESKVSATQYHFSSKHPKKRGLGGGVYVLPSDVGLNAEKFCPNVTAITEPMDQ